VTVLGCVFSTSLGRCGLCWSETGLRAVQLPEASEEALRRRLRRVGASLVPTPAPGFASEALRRLQRHLDGDRDPLLDLPLDLEGLAPFTRQVYERARSVLPGRTTSYGALATECGRPGAARAVGQALAQNPFTLVVPCHRVLAAGGGLGGFSAHGSTATKLRLLTLEGADLGAVAVAGVRELARRDPRLRAVIRRVGPFRLHWAQREDRFTALAEAIVHQQVSMAAGRTIFGRLLALAGRPEDSTSPAETAWSGQVLEPARLLRASAEELRGAGLSRQKASYLADLARRTEDGALPLDRLDRLDDERVIEELTRVKGIGRWSAEMFLIFRLGRLDVLPVDDLGLRKNAQRLYRLRSLPAAARLHQLGELWRPFRSIATWYLWRAGDTGGLAS
jgi:O-6-methylguanine DNA methyltransferase